MVLQECQVISEQQEQQCWEIRREAASVSPEESGSTETQIKAEVDGREENEESEQKSEQREGENSASD